MALAGLAVAVAIGGCSGGAAEPQVEREPYDVEREPRVEPEPALQDNGGGRADPQDDPYAFSYQVGYDVCGADVDQLYDEAGTRDPRGAAEWYGDGLTDGPHREGGVAGCLDAALGSDPKY